MTPDQALEAAAVMVAFANGRKIERKVRTPGSVWESIQEVQWQWAFSEYRVAPEPWEGKIWVHENGDVYQDGRSGWTPKMFIERGWRLITAKEVAE